MTGRRVASPPTPLGNGRRAGPNGLRDPAQSPGSGRRAWLEAFEAGQRHPLKVRLVRYAAGSFVAVAVSEITLTALVGFGAVPAGVAAILAFVAGAVPNWVLNRRWAWGRRGRVSLRRELIPYVGIVAATLIAAVAATAGVDASTRHLAHWTAVCLVDGAYIAVTGLMFVVKFVLFDRVIFIHRPAGA